MERIADSAASGPELVWMSSMSGTRISTGQFVLDAFRPLYLGEMYIFLAEYLQSGSMGQERQFVEVPADAGLRVRVNCWTEPEEVIVSGR